VDWRQWAAPMQREA